MPSLITPRDMPEDVVRAVETMGNKARTEILRVLLQHPPMTRAELEVEVLKGEGFSGGGSMISKHLLGMEEDGMVICDVPRDQRQGRITRWATTPERAALLAETWLSYVLGRTPDPTDTSRLAASTTTD